ncbi:hypothetical protein LAUMK13_02832 [Mycobacterium innocens]|uniref:Uncharacterized protein n=1 Tax=Mycobacterium innocens TaxID=2341083 RepID=A0A498Q5T8_9MYCO|nr:MULTISPECIES: hypothetical protein [Mycobacterium]VBA39922.1 hypothetical protein LAUMK13_02832 [Mycobacterium innocens]
MEQRVADALTLGGADGYLTDVEELGVVAVHPAVGNCDLHVTSVLASKDAWFEAVLAAAHDIARREATGSAVRRRALTDMALGDGKFWTITQEPRPGGEQVRVVLPAWQATSNHDLTTDPGLGFAAVGRALATAATMSPGIPDIGARQSAAARYGRWVFEPAAVTAVALRSADGVVGAVAVGDAAFRSSLRGGGSVRCASAR